MGSPTLTPDQSLAPPSAPLPVAGASPDQAQAVQQVVQAPVAQATQTHRDFASKILGAISDVLGGKSSPQYSRDASGALSTTQHINTRGEQVRNIIGTALQGAAAGASQQGPNAEGRAFAAGLGGKMQADQAQDQAKRSQADQDFDVKQKQTLQNAQIANYNNQNLLERRRLDQADTSEQDKLIENQNALATKLQEAGATTPPVMIDGKNVNGTPGNEQDMMKYFSDPANHAVPDGQALMHTYSRDDKGQMIDTIHFVPKDQLKTSMVAPSPEAAKAYGLPSGTKISLGDSIALDTKLKEQNTKAFNDKVENDLKKAQTAKAYADAQKDKDAEAKGGDKPVYAVDLKTGKTILTTGAQAQAQGLSAIRPVKNSDIKADQHDIKVLNDIAAKGNNLVSSMDALDQGANQRTIIANALSAGEKDNDLHIGAFGTSLPTAQWNRLLDAENQKNATQKTRDYIVAVLSAREAAMGMQKVLTGSSRANEQQIKALQATIPGVESDSKLARQKMAAFTQNIDMLRQGLPEGTGVNSIEIAKDDSQLPSIDVPHPKHFDFVPGQGLVERK